MILSELAQDLMERQRKARHAKRNRPWQPSMTPATSLGYKCDRRIVYQRCWPEEAEGISEELASIFAEGDLHQKDVRAELLKLGFEVVETEVNFKDQRLEITGTIDGKIEIPDEKARNGYRRVPLEIKSTNGSAPSSEDAWKFSENQLLRRYYVQLQTYLFLTEEPEGLALFKNKATGLWSIVGAHLDYDLMERVCQKAERVRDAVKKIVNTIGEDNKKNLLPDRLADRSECVSCPWKTLCNPAEAEIDPMMLVDDESLLSQLRGLEQVEDDAAWHKKTLEEVKQRFKLTSGNEWIVGGADGFLVRKKKHGKNGWRILIGRLGK